MTASGGHPGNASFGGGSGANSRQPQQQQQQYPQQHQHQHNYQQQQQGAADTPTIHVPPHLHIPDVPDYLKPSKPIEECPEEERDLLNLIEEYGDRTVKDLIIEYCERESNRLLAHHMASLKRFKVSLWRNSGLEREPMPPEWGLGTGLD